MKKLLIIASFATGLCTGPALADPAFTQDSAVVERLSDVVSARDKGARCDGVTDDTAAIQRALDAGRTVQLPSGVCIVTTVKLPANAALIGQSERSELRRKPGASRGPVVIATNIQRPTIANLTVNGNSSAATGGDSNIFITGSYDVTVDHVRSVNSLGHGISIQGGTDAARHTISTVRNSVVQNTAQYGIEVQDTGRVLIQGNRVARSGSYGILVYGTVANSIRNVSIVENVVVDAGGSGIAIPFVNGGTATTPGVEELTVTGNSVESSALNGYVIQGRLATVTGNAASRNGTTMSHQGFVINVLSVTATGNTATRNAGVGIDFGDCKRVIASGNLVEENGIIGIEINSTEDFSVTGNVVVNNNITGNAGELAAGILAHAGTGGYPFVGGTQNGTIANNVVRAGPRQKYGIKVTADTSNIRIIGNDALASGAVRDFEILAPTGKFFESGNVAMAPTLNAASTVTIPQVGNYFMIASGKPIASIVTDSGTYQLGRTITLQFKGAAVVGNGTGNLLLSGPSFSATPGSSLTLMRSDADSWIEISRRQR
jgi:parallel beta-helix repeat protein